MGIPLTSIFIFTHNANTTFLYSAASILFLKRSAVLILLFNHSTAKKFTFRVKNLIRLYIYPKIAHFWLFFEILGQNMSYFKDFFDVSMICRKFA